MRRTKTLELVKSILEKVPQTRSDDFELIREVAVSYNLVAMPFGYVLSYWRCHNLPPFEAITRARRKVQEQYPELRATKVVTDRRAEMAKEYHDTYGTQGKLQL